MPSLPLLRAQYSTFLAFWQPYAAHGSLINQILHKIRFNRWQYELSDYEWCLPDGVIDGTSGSYV